MDLNPNASVLERAIQSVPDRGLLGMPEVIRQGLLAAAQDFSGFLGAKSYQSARIYLRQQFLPLVNTGISDFVADKALTEFDRGDVLRVMDGILTRLPALREVVPYPQNGLIELKTDRESYISGERAQIEAISLHPPLDKEKEIYVTFEVNGLPQRSNRGENGSWVGATRRLEPGVTKVKAQAFIQNARMARGLEAAIVATEERLLNLERDLREETDPERRAELELEIEKLTMQTERMREELSKMRTPIGHSLEVLVEAN